ncbi:MAG: hypothetical protein HFH24_00245 [Ruminococcus sp.]|nr:hypothetical protein [Ruminococcus sp.]
MVVRKWIEDIRTKTKEMSREQTVEYVATYYWYHILLVFLALGLLLLLIYHIGWGDRRKEFTCALVNQEVDFARDREMTKQFASFSGKNEKKLAVDSDYLISYEDIRLEGANESSYEKFFFNWSSGVLDAVVMPESFYQYCRKLGGAFLEMEGLLSEDEISEWKERFYQDAGKNTGIYLEGLALEEMLQTDPWDPVLLVFPAETKQKELCGAFLKFAMYGHKMQD